MSPRARESDASGSVVVEASVRIVVREHWSFSSSGVRRERCEEFNIVRA